MSKPSAHRASSNRPRIKRWIKPMVMAVGVLVVGAALWNGYQLWSSWQSVERLPFDPSAARARLDKLDSPPLQHDEFLANAAETDDEVTDFAAAPSLGLPDGDGPASVGTTIPELALLDGPYKNVDIPHPEPPATSTTTTIGLAPPPTSPPTPLTGYLLIGSDGTVSAGHADAIFLAIKSNSGPILVPIPRSLYINNPCTDTPMRLSLLLQGCPGVANGPDLVALALEDFTGVTIPHYVVVAYAGFAKIVDALGGIEICSDTARGINGQVIVPAGCNLVDGRAASFWVQNRSQDELVDGQWRAVAGDGELSRLQRQRIAMLAMYRRAGSLGSAGALMSVAQSVSDTFALDSGFSLSAAVNLAWSMRGGLRQLSIPVRQAQTPDGRYVLYPTEPFSVTLGQ